MDIQNILLPPRTSVNMCCNFQKFLDNIIEVGHLPRVLDSLYTFVLKAKNKI